VRRLSCRVGAGKFASNKLSGEESGIAPAGAGEFRPLARNVDIILVEGAGSPAEINLRAGDIAKYGICHGGQRACGDARDIDRGPLSPALPARISFWNRTSVHASRLYYQQIPRRCRLFEQGLTAITRLTGWPSLGVVPWLPQRHGFQPKMPSISIEHMIRCQSV